MEFTKINKCWTLWYLKKWIVYYNYVIIKDTLYDEDYKEIVKIFNHFIESLPQELQRDAEDFFYEIDIRKDNFMPFSKYSIHTTLPTIEEEKEFKIRCKKIYFMYIMNLWWQSWYKEDIKNLLNLHETHENIETTIKTKILSDWHDLSKVREQISDFHATIRNERQIFFYYGFIYWNESKFEGFNRPTIIGDLIERANFHELLLLREHQKIKMISQSPVTEIKNLSSEYLRLDTDRFWISYHPYYQLIKIIKENKWLSYDDYKFIISRLKNTHNKEEIIKILNQDVSSIERTIKSFKRVRDLKDEDFQKELKKYLLWIQKLPKDKEYNYYWVVEYTWKEIMVDDEEKLSFIENTYWQLVDYMDYTYWEDYQSFEKYIKEEFEYNIISKSHTRWETLTARYEWVRYIINIDKNILLSLIYIWYCLKIWEFTFTLSNDQKNDIQKDYTTLLTFYWINNKKDFLERINDIENQFRTWRIQRIEDGIEIYEEVSISEWEIISNEQLSKESETSIAYWYVSIKKRERSQKLKSLLQQQYIINYRDPNGMISCDCCKNNTFKNNKDIPYLEFHHIIPFSTDLWPDHYLNLVWICPMCHRKFHYIKNEYKQSLYQDLSRNNNPQKTIQFRLEWLYKENVLKPRHLDFLLKENAIDDETYDTFMSMQ